MIRKTAHGYQKFFEGKFGQVRDFIVVEATWLGYHEPCSKKNISCFVYEMMKESGQLMLAEEYKMLPFEVNVLDIKRTLCEKIMSLVRFSHSVDAIGDLKSKIRHTYDIHKMLENKELRNFFDSEDFFSMLLKVVKDDVFSYKNNNNWLQEHPSKALIFLKPKETWEQLKSTYLNNFSDLVYGGLPEESEVFNSINKIAEKLKEIKWEIEISG